LCESAFRSAGMASSPMRTRNLSAACRSLLPRQHDVEKNEIDVLPEAQLQAAGAVARGEDLVALALEGVDQPGQDCGIVFDDEDSGHRGKESVK